jgi:outer membrane murein-binding lipoprotein Lpp
MNLYEIDREILGCIDMETGEIVDGAKLEALQIARDEKIENVALWVKNLVAEAAALKAEKEAFAERQKAAEKKAESLKRWLSTALGGQKFTTERVAVSFRKSEGVVVEDAEAFVVWAQTCGREDLLTIKAPEINKAEVKKALKGNEQLDFVALETRSNITIK